MDVQLLLRKSRAVVVKGPAVARNVAFSLFNYWPTRRLRNDSIRNLPIYCVSPVAAIRRRRIIRNQVLGMGLTAFAFVDAIASDRLDRDDLQRQGLYDDAAAKTFHHRSLTPSEIACSLSHGRAYDLIVSHTHEISMIIEDDSLFVPSRLDSIRLDDLPDGWDIAFLNSFVEQGRPQRRIAHTLYFGDAYTGSSCAYLVSRKGVRLLAEGYKPVIHASDGYAGRNDIFRLAYYPDCVLNGSVCHYYNSTIEYIRPGANAKAG